MKTFILILSIVAVGKISSAQTYHNVTSTPNTSGNGSISIGLTGTYQFIQSHGSQPLKINPIGNDIHLGAALSGINASFLNGVNVGTATGDLNVGSTSNPFSVSGRGVIFANGSSNSLIGLGVEGANKGYMYHDGTDMSIVSANAGAKLNLYSSNVLALTLNSDQSATFAGALIGTSANFSSIVGIGTTTPDIDSKLTVAGKIHSQEVKVTTNAGADFVFEEDYKLRSLSETESFIKQNKHLPEIASAKDMVKNGIDLGEMNIKLLQKIEELTLYVIDLAKENKEQGTKIKEQQSQIDELRFKP